MIRKIVFLALSMALSHTLNAQFKIKGEIANYNNQPVLIKIYDNGMLRLLSRLETDNKGNFTYDFPKKYNGLIQMEFVSGGYQMVSDNKDIEFTTDFNSPNHKIQYKDGVNKELSDYNDYMTLMEIKNNALSLLKNYYTSKDEFYTPLNKEIQRIESLKPKEISNEEVQYYLDTQKDLTGQNEGSKSVNEALEEVTNRIVNDGVEFENYGFLPKFVTQYIQLSVSGAKSREEAGDKIKQAIDDLLNKLGEDTQRGQAVLYNVINLLDVSGFKELSNNYTKRASELKCEINPELKSLIEGNNNVQIGKEVPNIKFDKPINGKKDLYAIKADKKLIIFWGSWCGHCKHEMPFIKEFYPQFKKDGGEIFAFGVDLDKNEYNKMIKDTKWYNYTDLLKWDSPIVKEYAVTGTPTMILVDKDNKVIKTGSRISDFVDFK